MATKLHSAVSGGARHPIHQLTYPDAANRIAGTNEGTGATPKDFDVAKQDDDDSLWLLTSAAGPTWMQIASVNGLDLADDAPLLFGDSSDGSIRFSTAQATANAMLSGVDSTSRLWILTDKANILKDHDHAAQSDPTLVVHSVKDPDTDNTEWISISHNQTSAIVDSGSGGVKMGPTGGLTLSAGVVNASEIRLGANQKIYFGGGFNALMLYDTLNQTNGSVLVTVPSASNSLIICQTADASYDFTYAAQTNPTLFIPSANQTATEYVSLAHDQTDAKKTIGSGSKYTNHVVPTELADDASFDLPDASAGFGFIMASDNEEYAQFSWTTAGVVTLINNSANVVASDTDTNLCIFDNGTAVRVRNRLGAAKSVVFDLNYTLTPV